ncbi:MAG: hypothetical protein KBC64_01515 [Simkaniaceae bacterium]|nr:hypothetical protein [Simkaniaceae bacterium]
MKKFIFTIFCLSYLNSGFSFDNPSYPTAAEISPFSKPHLDTSPPNSYSYFTVGSGMFIQQVGIGQRYKNFETCKAFDISFSVHFSVPMIVSEPGLLYRDQVFPSLKYTYLTYRDNSPTSRYSGISGELLFMTYVPYFFPIPNIGLIWGKERENIRFSQLQLNIFPAIACILGTGILLSSDGSYDSDIMGMMLVVGGSATLISYDIAF